MVDRSKVPEHIKKFEQLKKKAGKIVDTVDLAHSDAYSIAAKEFLTDKEGNIDYEKLEDADVQEKFVDKMKDHYIKKANQYFKSDINKKDKMQVDLLMKAYTGVTGSELERYIRTHGKDYTLNQHEANKKKFKEKVHGTLSEAAASHLKDEHAEDFTKHLGIEDLIKDHSLLKIGDLVLLHSLHEKYETLTPEIIKDAYRSMEQPEPIFLKKPKKEKKEKEAEYQMAA